MKKVTQDYIDLRKSIASYIDKYPKATKESNTKMLEELQELRKDINDSIEARTKYNKIRNELTLRNGGFAMNNVMKYSVIMSESTPVSELFQEATIGIMESIDTFDIDKNTSFTTYAFYHIRKRIVDYIKKNKLIKAPRDIARNIKHVKEMQEKLFSERGKEPSAKDILIELKIQKDITLKENIIDSILILLELNSAGHEDSFISEYKDQSYCEDYPSQLFRKLELNILSNIQKYTEKQQRIIKLRFGISEEYPHTIEEIKLMLDIDDKELNEIGS